MPRHDTCDTRASQQKDPRNHFSQVVEVVSEGDKYPRVSKLLEKIMDGVGKILVFVETKRNCDAVTRQMRQDGWPALLIHGGGCGLFYGFFLGFGFSVSGLGLFWWWKTKE